MVPSLHVTTRTLACPWPTSDSMEPESSMNNHYRITLIAVGIMHARLLTLVFQDGYNGGTISSKPPSYATRGIARFRPPSGQGYELIIVSVAATYDGCDSRPSDCQSSTYLILEYTHPLSQRLTIPTFSCRLPAATAASIGEESPETARPWLYFSTNEALSMTTKSASCSINGY